MDLWERFGLGPDDLGDRVPWRDVGHLLDSISADYTSALFASQHGWPARQSTSNVLANLIDMTAWAAGGKSWPGYVQMLMDANEKPARTGNAGGRSPDEVRRILAERGPRPKE